jgi:hypothetical protein
LDRLPYEESSIKMGNTQEMNVNRGLLDRVEARQGDPGIHHINSSSRLVLCTVLWIRIRKNPKV